MSRAGRIVVGGVVVLGGIALGRAVQRAARDPRSDLVDWEAVDREAARRLASGAGRLAEDEVAASAAA